MLVHKHYDGDPRVRRYVRALVAAGFEVDVLCARRRDRPHISRTDGARVFTIPVGHRQHRGPAGYLWEYGVAFVLYCVRLLGMYARNRYHIIHTHNMPDYLILASLVPRLFGAKAILDIHDPMPEFYASRWRKGVGSVVVRLLRLEERLSAALADAIITANPLFRTRLVERGIAPHKITVINNFPDASLFDRDRYAQERTAPRECFRLIYPGTIAPRYGLDVAIHALPALIHRIPNIRLHIVGSQTAHAAQLVALADQLGVAPFVEMTPGVAVNFMPGLLAAADVGIYPALPDPHMTIAVPGKVLEYAVMGLPIVSSRLRAVEELFPPSCVLYFEPGNVEQFTRCVLELHETPARRMDLVQNTDREFVQKHSWAAEQREYLGLLDRLLRAHP
jgi:glycosyltransferase involved in cell wall biosynthesis